METKNIYSLPNQILHPFHPLHPLTPVNPNRTVVCYCDACRKSGLDLSFRCNGCNFDLDGECALLLPNIKYEGHEEHLLTLFDKIYYPNGFLCNSCNTPCSALVLRCVDCNFNVHKSCAHDKSFVELPKQIQHIFHPLHPLILRDHPRKGLSCNACWVGINNFSFRCEECDFTLGHECTSLAPTIKYEGHHHLLTLFHQFDGYFSCGSCEAWGYGFVFRCVKCDFTLHPHCLPSFPRTIQHKCHICPLTLTNSVPEDADTDEYYCDACEKQRREDESVYYCADCCFVAHIKCVISEVLPLLVAEQEKIEWPKEADIGHAFTVEDLLGSSAVDEVMERGVSAAMPSETVGVEVTVEQVEVGIEVTADLVIAKLEGENAKLRAEVEALKAKLEALESEHAQCVASKMSGERDKCLSEASASFALRAEVEALTAKLEAPESAHAHCVASGLLSERDKCLSEALASE